MSHPEAFVARAADEPEPFCASMGACFRAFVGLALACGLSACPENASEGVQPNPLDSGFDAGADAPRPDPVPVTVVTWNVLNLFNDVRDSLEITASMEDIAPTAQYQAKLTGLAGALGTLGADIAVLQEVENQNVVDDLAARTGRFPHSHITQGNDPRGIDIAILSEYPIEKVVSHKDVLFKASTDPVTNFKFARDVLEAHLVINGRRVVLLGVHYKSGLTDSDKLKRRAEAEKTRSILTQVKFDHPSAAVIVLGDFNMSPEAEEMQALYGAPPLLLSSVTTGMPAGERYSVTFGGNKQLYDDQVVDPVGLTLLDPTFPSSVFIFHSAEVDAFADHDPVKAVYQVN